MSEGGFPFTRSSKISMTMRTGHLRDPPRRPIFLSRFICKRVLLILWRVSRGRYSSTFYSFNSPTSNFKSFNLCIFLYMMTIDLFDFRTVSFAVRLASFTSSDISISHPLRYLISLSSFSFCDAAYCTTWWRATLAEWNNSLYLTNWYCVNVSWDVSLLTWFTWCVLVIISFFDRCECSWPITFTRISFISLSFFECLVFSLNTTFSWCYMIFILWECLVFSLSTTLLWSFTFSSYLVWIWWTTFSWRSFVFITFLSYLSGDDLPPSHDVILYLYPSGSTRSGDDWPTSHDCSSPTDVHSCERT